MSRLERFTWSEGDIEIDDELDVGDEYNPQQLRDPKGTPTGGQWTKTLKGTSAERVAMRKLLKEEQNPENRKKLREQIIASFALQIQQAKNKGDLAKVAELEGKIAKYSKQYGVPNPLTPKSVAAANVGFTASEVSGAKEVMKEAVPEFGKNFTPEEIKNFNELVQFGGLQNAKGWTLRAKGRLQNAPAAMTHGELAHIVAYSEQAYAKSNSQLRAGVMDEGTWRHVNGLNGALSRFPNHHGTVYRHANMPKETLALYKPGMIVEERGFTSTSKSYRTGPLSYEIVSRTGKDISKVSSYPNEQEVLFRSGTRFKVLNVQSLGDKTKITMEEVVYE